MSKLEIKKLENCKYASVSLGEVMLRLDPGEGQGEHCQTIQGMGRRGRI